MAADLGLLGDLLEMCGFRFCRFSAKLGPKTSPDLQIGGARLAVPVAPQISPADQF